MTYDINQTPHLVSVNPKYGTVEGGTSVTLRTSDLSALGDSGGIGVDPARSSDVIVDLDGVSCVVDSVT